MKVAEFIRDSVLRPRLVSAGCLVVYDADRRHRSLCNELAGDTIRVIDASEGSIECREAALRGLKDVGLPQPAIEGLLIYVPTARPETDVERQGDPFAVYAACGAVFPRDDGDSYLSLCLRAKPDHATDVRTVFAASPEGPPFAVIDAIGGGGHWPQLRTLLTVQSAREILLALMAPTAGQIDALGRDEAWVQETKDFLKVTLGLALKTRGKTWNAVANELWHYVLFSEFAFDLPGGLPETLRSVPRAPVEARAFVEDVCDQLRGTVRTAGTYIERAETVELELELTSRCATIDDLGERDTFPFEERAYLTAASRTLQQDDLESTRLVLARRKSSIWRRRGEAQTQWDLVGGALAVCEACEDLERQLPEHSRSQAALLDFYVRQLREADRLQREFEQAVGMSAGADGALDGLIDHARARYRRLAERVQTVFMKHLENEGWPPPGRLANVSAFDRFVAGRLNERDRRIAYVMVDALRYELGLELERLLAEDGSVEMHVAYAQLPSVTPVGMASLLPEAQTKLRFRVEQEALQPMLDGSPVRDVRQRMDVFAKRYGDRFKEMALGQFLRARADIPSTVDLLVLRSTEIDSQLENNPESTLRLIPDTLRSIRSALHKLRGLGFKEAVIVTDHGFFLNAQADAGDVCSKPPGVWAVNAHDRLLLGEGMSDAHNVAVGASKVGILGEVGKVAMPRTMAPYRAGHLYFHGGASLAEAVVPVLVAKLKPTDTAAARKVTLDLSYKAGAARITTRLPLIDLYWPATDDMFSTGTSRDVLLVAVDKDDKVVGEPRPGADVNPATHTVNLGPGQRRQVILKMDPFFEGKFTVKALDPTTSASFASLTLETDYTV
jgi:hypothetical protein